MKQILFVLAFALFLCGLSVSAISAFPVATFITLSKHG
jgi:hypothetical protein